MTTLRKLRDNLATTLVHLRGEIEIEKEHLS